MIYAQKEKRVYKDLSEEDQHNVKSILFILDKYCIGDASYHELTMAPGGEDLQRLYLIKQCKDEMNKLCHIARTDEMNKLCHIARTPGSAQGAQLDFNTELESVIRNQVMYYLRNPPPPTHTHTHIYHNTPASPQHRDCQNITL